MRLLSCVLLMLLGPGVQAMAATSFSECSAAYKAERAAGKLQGVGWDSYSRDVCKLAPAAPATGTTATMARIEPGPTSFPDGIAPKYRREPPGHARLHTCADAYRANKAAGTLGGLKWQKKGGGGYYSLCNARLKGQKPAG